MKYLWREWPRLKARLAGAKKRLLLLDFDGTLVAIAPTPEAVRLRATTRRKLDAAARDPRNRVAVISGRSLASLRSYVRTKDVYFVGNHGLEMRGRGIAPPAEARRARKLRFLMRLLTEKLRADLYYLPGVLVEDKGLTVSVHYRNVAREHMPAFMQVLRFFQQRYKKHPIAWRNGKKVWEAFPTVRWNKGYAALYLLRRLRGALPVAVGDDRTDEDMFRAVRRLGIAVRIGRTKTSRAQYYLRSQAEIDTLLEELTR